MRLPKIYPITDTKISGLSLVEQTKHLIDAGAQLIQLREKNALSGDFYESAKACVHLSKTTSTKIIINDRVDIALAVKSDGVHLGKSDLSPIAAKKILGNDAIIGYSTHTLDQAIAAAKLPIDYVAIGPVFPTSTKKNPDDVVGLRTITQVRAAIGELPLVAIGGIKLDNFLDVLAAGADSVAIISGLFSGTGDIASNFKSFTSKTKE